MVFYPDMSCYPTHFWEVKHANLGGVFDGNIGTDPQCLCHVLHPGGHRFRQSLPGTDNIDCCSKFATGLKCLNRHRSKNI